MTLGIAVIGAGLMGADHARIVAEEMPGAKLQVICDRDSERARAVADATGSVDIAGDPEAVIARADVDAVIIASPDPTHTPLSLACISAGKPVLCEKPLSQSSQDCLAVMAAEQQAGRAFVQLGFMRRYDECYRQYRQAQSTGLLGRALMMHNFHRNVETPAADFTGAMAITNSAPHEFDIARYVLDTEITAISCFQPRRTDERVAPVVMVLETEDGQLVTVEINNNAAYGYDVRSELVGEKGSMASNPVAYTRCDMALTSATAYQADWRARYFDAYRQQNRAFLAFAQGEDFPSEGASCWDGYCSSMVAEAGVRALHSGERQAIALIKRPEFYA